MDNFYTLRVKIAETFEKGKTYPLYKLYDLIIDYYNLKKDCEDIAGSIIVYIRNNTDLFQCHYSWFSADEFTMLVNGKMPESYGRLPFPANNSKEQFEGGMVYTPYFPLQITTVHDKNP